VSEHPDRVFAYGSNLHLEDLAGWMGRGGFGEPRLGRVLPAVLPDFRLVWNYPSQSRAGGAANVEPCDGEAVYGAVLEVDARTFSAVDVKEGHPERYVRRRLPVCLLAGGETTAWVYEVTPGWRRPHQVWPSRGYLALVLEGARRLGLPEAYLDALAATPTLDGS